MTLTRWRFKKSLLLMTAGIAVIAGAMPALAVSDSRVSVGSPPGPFSQNKQNEPALAVDASHPNILAAGANEEVDMEACNAGNPTTCPFTQGVGVSGVYFSSDGGITWTQPSYTGWTARNCLGPAPCTPQVGPIGTLPWYYENGLVSDGDPAVAFGPRPNAIGAFSWGNGSRLYYANLTSNFGTTKRDETFKGFEGIAVSRTDNVAAAAAGVKSAWMPPVIAARQSSTTFSDKEQIWADNASSSPFFGNVYVCYAAFVGQEKGNAAPAPLVLLTSTDGGNTWRQRQISSAVNNAQHNPPDGCTVRTDSNGVVYVFGLGTGLNKQTGELLSRSFDGGQSFEQFRFLFPVVKPGFFDPALGRPVMDGIAGARVDLAAAPSVDIANGAPTGSDATNELLINWADGPLNSERSLVKYSTNRGDTWQGPIVASTSPDRPFYTAISISPNGTDAYLTYDAYLAPYQPTTGTPRPMQAVVKHADLLGTVPGSFTELNRGTSGDARGSSQNGLTAEFFGDYVYAIATRSYGSAVWNDARNEADCPAIDVFRAGIEAGTSPARPAPNSDCPANFGNSDIYGGSYPDPTP